jgi:hypothetical protein
LREIRRPTKSAKLYTVAAKALNQAGKRKDSWAVVREKSRTELADEGKVEDRTRRALHRHPQGPGKTQKYAG